MERLTSWCEEIEEAFLSCEKCKKNGMTECWSQENCTQTVVDRLAEIEDILGNEYDLDRLRELVKADREGRCVVLPCKVGDILWSFSIYSSKVYSFAVTDTATLNGKTVINTDRMFSIRENDFGETIFKTREEAESALKAMKEREEK